MVQEIASGMNDTRPKLLKLLTDPHRLTRFGFVSIDQLFAMQGRSLGVMVPTDTKHSLVDDFIAVIASMASRIYGQRHSIKRAEKIK